MSDYWINIIPENHDYVPSHESQGKAMDLFWKIAPDAEDVKAETSEAVRFIDCGENLERIRCPACNAEIDIDWWRDRMDDEFEQGFALKLVAMPCCGRTYNMKDLDYDWPQGFARFSIEAMNPGIADISNSQLAEFEKILGCRVRKILQHI